jgi:hypothetical protein
LGPRAEKRQTPRYPLDVATTARRLILIYAALVVLLNLSVLLPGNPDYTSFWGLVGSVIIQGLVVWGLWRQWPLALVFGLFMAVLTLPVTFLSAAPWEVGTVLLVTFSLLQVVVLAMPPLATFVASGKPAASS